MSHVFTVRGVRPSSFSAVCAGLALHDLRMVEEAPTADEWPEGTVHFHREDVSARNTEITRTPEGVEVRVMSMSAPEDVELALRFVEVFASELGAATVDAEMVGEIELSRLREVFDDRWIASQWESGVRVVRALVADGRGPITVPGATRSFVVGARLLAEIETADGMLERMRRVQWIEREGFRAAGRFQASKDGADFTFAVLLPDEDLFVPVVDRILIEEPKETRALFDASKLGEVIGEPWTPLDERQGCFRALRGAAWTEIGRRARLTADG